MNARGWNCIKKRISALKTSTKKKKRKKKKQFGSRWRCARDELQMTLGWLLPSDEDDGQREKGRSVVRLRSARSKASGM